MQMLEKRRTAVSLAAAWAATSLRVGAAVLTVLAVVAPAARAERIAVGGVERTYALGGVRSSARGLLIVLHGGGGSGASAARQFGMEPVAARERLLIAYPDAIAKHWNDGRRDDRGRGSGAQADDVAFLSELARAVARDIDGGPVFVAGVSNGGMMTYRLACETAGLFAGFAAVIANLPVDLAATCNPKRAQPVLIMNGTEDRLMPWRGGAIVAFGQSRGEVLSATATFERWRGWNRCAAAGSSEARADRDRGDGSTVSVSAATGCPAGGETVLVTIMGGGHQIPRLAGRERPLLDRFLGAANRDIEAAEEIWHFFSAQLGK